MSSMAICNYAQTVAVAKPFREYEKGWEEGKNGGQHPRNSVPVGLCCSQASRDPVDPIDPRDPGDPGLKGNTRTLSPHTAVGGTFIFPPFFGEFRVVKLVLRYRLHESFLLMHRVCTEFPPLLVIHQ